MVAKFLSKYILEVIPSIVATVVGAYIVTHYINAKSDAEKPKAAIVAPANTAKAVEASAPKPAKAESAKADPDTAAETATAPTEPRRRPPVLREKAAAKPVAQPSEAKGDDTRDANDIAREAIARLRNSDPAPATEQPRAQEVPRVQEALRPQERTRVNVTAAPVVTAPAPIPAPSANQVPAANAVPPLNEVTIAPSPQPPVVRADESFRPTPPADIPSRPLDLRAKENTKERTSVAEDVVSTAKTVFHAVIPGIN